MVAAGRVFSPSDVTAPDPQPPKRTKVKPAQRKADTVKIAEAKPAAASRRRTSSR
jgi:hypothetical protein